MAHIVDGEFQSDRFPNAPRGTIQLEFKDPRTHDLIWEYAERWRSEDPAFADEVQSYLRSLGFQP